MILTCFLKGVECWSIDIKTEIKTEEDKQLAIQSLKQKGENKKARSLARLFLKNSTFESYQEAVVYLENQKFNLALQSIQSALAQEPIHFLSLLRRAQIYYFLNKNNEALIDLNKLVEIDNQEPEVYLWLGKVHLSLGHYSQAQTYFTLAMTQLPRSQQVVMGLSEALILQGKKSEGIRLLQQDYRQNPGHFEVKLKLLQNKNAKDKNLRSLLKQYLDSKSKRFESDLGIEIRSEKNLLIIIEEIEKPNLTSKPASP